MYIYIYIIYIYIYIYMHIYICITDYCGSQPCQNAGTCSNLTTGFQCICATGFTGDVCQTGMLCNCEL